MADNNLSNKQVMIQTYMKELMKLEFPELDTSDSSPFMEMFGSPHVDLLTPLVEFADRITLMQSIENASVLTTEEMDKLGAKYYLYRDPGARAMGYAILIFSDIPITGILIIPSGVRVVSKDELGYRTMQTLTLNQNQLVDYYDPDSFRYKVPVQIEAEGVGTSYNVEIGEILSVDTMLDNLEGVTNDVAITGGIDEETNEEFAKKIEESAFAPNLGVNRGYIRFMKSFPQVKDVLIAGYGHPLMQRDIIGEFVNPGFFHQTVKEAHWGTKIDIYLRGKNLVEHIEDLTVESNKDGKLIVRLAKKPIYDVTDIKMYADFGEQDDPNIDPVTLYVTDYVLRKDEGFETQGTLEEDVWVELNDKRLEVGSNIRIRYRYNSLLEEIHTKMYEGDERPPTADVKLKQSNEKFIYGSLVLKMKSPLGVRERDKSWIRQKTYNWLEGLKMGEEVQFSDITIPLTTLDENTMDETSLVDYIKMPYQFMVMENNSKYMYYCMNETQRGIVENFKIEKPFLYQVFQDYKDYVTTYDFFDIIHALTFDNGLKTALNEIDFMSYEWGQQVLVFKLAKDIFAKSLILNEMIPSVHPSEEQEHFQLGDLNIYEDRNYGVEEWKNTIGSLQEIAALHEENKDKYLFIHLVVYCIAMVYICTTDEDLTRDRTNLYNYIGNLLQGTPIGHKFNT